MKNKILKIVLLISLIEIIVLLNVWGLYNALTCSVRAPKDVYCDTLCMERSTIDEYIVSQNSLASYNIDKLKNVEDNNTEVLYDYIKNGDILVLKSGEEVNIINEDDSHKFLYIKTTSGDTLWINKQNVVKNSVEL